MDVFWIEGEARKQLPFNWSRTCQSSTLLIPLRVITYSPKPSRQCRHHSSSKRKCLNILVAGTWWTILSSSLRNLLWKRISIMTQRYQRMRELIQTTKQLKCQTCLLNPRIRRHLRSSAVDLIPSILCIHRRRMTTFILPPPTIKQK